MSQLKELMLASEGALLTLSGQVVGKRLCGRCIGFLDVQDSCDLKVYDPGFPQFEVVVVYEARSILRCLKMGDYVRLTGFVQLGKNSDTSQKILRVESKANVSVLKDSLSEFECKKNTSIITPSIEGRSFSDTEEKEGPSLCRFFINSGHCQRQNCPFLHSFDVKKSVFVKASQRKRAEQSGYEDDPFEADEKNQGSQRASAFVKLLQEALPNLVLPGCSVLDVAGGKGDVAVELAMRGVDVTVVDPRPVKVTRKVLRIVKEMDPEASIMAKYRGVDLEMEEKSKRKRVSKREAYRLGEKWLQSNVKQEQMMLDESTPELVRDSLLKDCSLVVGMHPDQATDPIISLGSLYRKPWVVVPCCVFGDTFPERRVKIRRLQSGYEGEGSIGLAQRKTMEIEEKPVRSFDDLLEYIRQSPERLGVGGTVREAFLNVLGKNRVMWWVPPELEE